MPRQTEKEDNSHKFGQGRVVASPEDFEEFLNWLDHSGRQQERRAAYLNYAERRSMPLDSLKERFGERKYLEQAKAGVIAECSGEFIHGVLAGANHLAEMGLSNELDLDAQERCMSEVSKARQQLSEFYAICAKEIFSSQMRSANMSDEAIDALIRTFDATAWGVDPLTAIIHGAQEAQSGAGKDLAAAFKSFVEHPSRRARLLSPKDDFFAMTPAEESRLGEFAPLIQYINEALQPQERAEMMARMMSYVDSGWAERDLIGGGTIEEIAEESPWSSHAALAEWRSVAWAIKERQAVDPSRFLGAFARRFGEIALSVKVEAGASKDDQHVKSAELLGASAKTWGQLAKIAKPRAVDVCVVSPGASRMLLTCATSDAAMMRQGDQLGRYLGAIAGHFQKQAAGNAPASIGIVDLPRIPDVSMAMFAPCLAQTSSATPYTQAGGDIFKSLAHQPTMSVEARMVDLANAVPFMHLMSVCFHKRPLIELVSLRLAGAEPLVWEGIQEAAKAGADPASAAMGAMAQSCSELVGLLQAHGFAAKTELESSLMHDAPTGAVERLVAGLFVIEKKMADSALRGKIGKVAPAPETAQRLSDFAEAMRSFAACLDAEDPRLLLDMGRYADEIQEWTATAVLPKPARSRRAGKK